MRVRSSGWRVASTLFAGAFQFWDEIASEPAREQGVAASPLLTRGFEGGAPNLKYIWCSLPATRHLYSSRQKQG